MPEATPPIAPTPDAAAMLSKAVVRAADRLAIPYPLLAEVLGVSSDTITWMHTGEYALNPALTEWNSALLLVGASRALDAICGDEISARKWLHNENPGLRGRPIDLIRSKDGLARVSQFLDASHAAA